MGHCFYVEDGWYFVIEWILMREECTIRRRRAARMIKGSQGRARMDAALLTRR